MLIAEAARKAARVVRSRKEDLVRQARGRADLPSQIVCYRGDEPIALISAQASGREELLVPVQIAVRGFCPDVVALTFDGWHALVRDDPRTGEHWERGAMESYIEECGFGAVVGEILTTQVVNRAGDMTSVLQRYAMRGRRVEWLDDPLVEPGRIGGYIPDRLRAIMTRPNLDAVLSQVQIESGIGLGLSPERRQAHMDAATVTVLQQQVTIPMAVVLTADSGTTRHQVLRRSLSRSQVASAAQWN